MNPKTLTLLKTVVGLAMLGALNSPIAQAAGRASGGGIRSARVHSKMATPKKLSTRAHQKNEASPERSNSRHSGKKESKQTRMTGKRKATSSAARESGIKTRKARVSKSAHALPPRGKNGRFTKANPSAPAKKIHERRLSKKTNGKNKIAKGTKMNKEGKSSAKKEKTAKVPNRDRGPKQDQLNQDVGRIQVPRDLSGKNNSESQKIQLTTPTPEA